MVKLTAECDKLAMESFPAGSFQQLFWQQQMKYNSLKNKSSMRWHPTIIRWCLYLKSKSAKAYEGVRSYLSLPSERTLYDYTHYMEHQLGINPNTVEQLIEKATNLGCYNEEHKSYVGILHDEISIKADLVYNKSSGELIGYIKLDGVTNELNRLQETVGSETNLAKSLLVTMIRGISTSLAYPYAAYASDNLSGSSLFTIMWECIESIEVVAGLKVLYICCDGAIQNRKFFSLHSSTISPEPAYCTKNPYSIEHRDIYFISDPPHLLKTARNCFASRSLWNGQNISWDYIKQLFENHCVKSEYRLCPKLTRDHIYLSSVSKMRVSYAAQVLSATVANALEHLWGDSVQKTVEFIRMMNKWFDIMNVRSLYEGQHSRNPNLEPFKDVNDPRLQWLQTDFLVYLTEWKDAVEGRPNTFTKKQKQMMQLSLQTIKGFQITCNSVAEIVRIVLASGAEFVLTNHLNQDPLEQLFGHCRHKGGSNSNPNIADACQALNTIRTVSTQAIAAKRGNTLPCRKQLDYTKLPKRTRLE